METTTLTALWLSVLAATSPTINNIDNVTDGHLGNNVTESSGGHHSARYSSPYFVSSSAILAFNIITIVTALVGALLNGYVLLALLLSKNSSKSKVNVFITHQTILDLTACIFLFIAMMVNRIAAQTSQDLATFLCLVFDSYSISLTAGSASVCGLVVITIERYAKIVHPIVYRNKYRSWMTRAGIIIPWIFGISMDLIPTLATTRVVRGRCSRGAAWPNNNMEIAWSVVKFLFTYALPLGIFVFAYWKILAVIRRQRKQVGQQAGASMSNAETVAQKTANRTEINIIKTMVLVSVSFALCFGCTRIYSILLLARAAPVIGILFYLFSVFSYFSRCVNPFIYATQYEVVKRWWRAKACRVMRGQHDEASMPASIASPPAAAARDVKTTRNV